MPLRYATPVSVSTSPKATTVQCTRINIHPGSGTIEYEFQAFTPGAKPEDPPVKVGDIHTSDTLGVTLMLDDVIGGKVTVAMLYAALKARAYATAQAALGNGIVE